MCTTKIGGHRSDQDECNVHVDFRFTKCGSTKEVQNTEVYIYIMLKGYIWFKLLESLHRSIGYQAIYTSLWLMVTLRIFVSTVC